MDWLCAIGIIEGSAVGDDRFKVRTLSREVMDSKWLAESVRIVGCLMMVE